MSQGPEEDRAPVDASIDTQAQLDYWNSVEASNDGMLGGYTQVHRVDIQGSKNFFAKLKLQRNPPLRIADCGAGIGRVSKNFLTKINSEVIVDIVEPVKKFTDQISEGPDFEEERKDGRIGEVINKGLEDWEPEKGAYWVIWNQWCLQHLTDIALKEYLIRCREGIREDGIVVVKENTSNSGEDMFDSTDSSVTRTDGKYRAIFKEAGLKVVATEIQRGMPKGIYPVRSYALRVY